MQGKLNWGRILLSGASFAAFGAGAAHAQGAGVSDEIIITATGRAAAIQDVPLAVTAVTGEALENAGVTDLRDLQQLAPSYRFFTGQSNSAGTTAYIRGLGTGGDNPGFESAVGYFIDGVYRNRSGVALTDLPEIERVEVLRGPQGTLFGRNTSAGAISVVTAGPDFETHAWMSATAGDYDLANASAGVTGALVEDVLAGRLDISGATRDGFIKDVNTGDKVNDRDRSSARAQLLWDIGPNASLRLIADAAQTDELCCAAVTLASTAVVPGFSIPNVVNGIAAGHGLVGTVSPPNPEGRAFASTPGRPYGEAVEEWGVSGQLDWDLGEVNLTSVTALRNWEAERAQDVDFSGIDRAYRDGYTSQFETTSQEIRLQGEWGRVNWLVGGYYSSEKLELRDTIRFGADAKAYVDTFAVGITPILAGSPIQLFGTFPQAFSNVIGGTGIPNALGAIALAGGYAQITGDATPTSAEAFAYAANPGNPGAATLQATYNNTAALLAASGPISGEGQDDNYGVDTTTIALFTHNEIALSDNLTLTIGARYNHEEKDFDATIAQIELTPAALSTCQLLTLAVQGQLPAPLASLGPAITSPGVGLLAQLGPLAPLVCSPAINEQALGSYADKREDNEWNGTASLAYDITDDLMVYGSFSRGYKAGGYNLDRLGFNFALTGLTGAPDATVAPSSNDLEFKPEFVDAVELGWKWSSFDGGLTLNGAIYYQAITDYQLLAFTGFNFATQNVSDAVSQGAELDFQLRPMDHLTIQGGVAYNDAYYDAPVSDGAPGGEVLPAGTKFTHAPEWTLTSAITYRQPIGETLEALFYLDGRWNSEYAVQTFGRNPATDNDAFATFNARVGLGPQDQRWSMEVWGRNITDEFYHLGAFAVPEQAFASLGGNYNIYPSEPRTWGVTLRARY